MRGIGRAGRPPALPKQRTARSESSAGDSFLRSQGRKMTNRKVLAGVTGGIVFCFALLPEMQAQQLAPKKILTLAVVKQLVAAAEKEACKQRCEGVIAIVDEGGILVYLERGDQAQPGGTDLALRKARTSYL